MAGLHNLLINEFTIESLLWLLLYKRETDSGTLKKCYTRSKEEEKINQCYNILWHEVIKCIFIPSSLLGTCTWRTPGGIIQQNVFEPKSCNWNTGKESKVLLFDAAY